MRIALVVVSLASMACSPDIRRTLRSATSEEIHYCVYGLVGVRGLEPPTSASRTLRASHLRYTPRDGLPCESSCGPTLAISADPYTRAQYSIWPG